MDHPTVALLAKPDGVSIRMVESLLSNLCQVLVFSKKENIWDDHFSHLTQKNLLQVINPEKEKELASFEYLVVLDHDLGFGPIEILNVATLAAAQSAKILIVLPFVAEGLAAWQAREKLRGFILKKIPEAGIVYAGELYGPRYFGPDKNFITRNLTNVVIKAEVESLDEATLYPVSVESFTRYLTRNLFSFGPYGKELAVFSEEISVPNFLSLLTAEAGEVSLTQPKFSGERQEVLGIKKVLVKAEFAPPINETLLWLKSNLRPETHPTGKKASKGYFLKRGVALGLLILVLAPFLLSIIGAALSFASFGSLKKGRLEPAEKSLALASFSFRNSLSFFSVYSRVPLISLLYRPFVGPVNILYLSAEAGGEGVTIGQKARELTSSVLGDTIYDPVPISREIAFRLREFYEKTGFLQGEVKALEGVVAKVAGSLIQTAELEEIRQKILGLETLSRSLPEILGKERPKTYLFLFQNNMELRPAGGFIGSFALVSFDAGRLVDINVFDVYAADGQLKGHVEPPAPIRKYLGEANWFLRDSNWDPDFPTSAARAQWFLDKEIDRAVDGVVGVDLEAVRGILRATGPVVLTDFNQVFDYNNLYERLQAEVESEFFPGSQKKASLLTALTRELMGRLSTLPQASYVPVARGLVQNLEERHIQAYLSDSVLQSAISKMGYSGELGLGTCAESCFQDFVAPVDANLGVTKANYFIERQFKLDITVAEGMAKKTLEITYQNTANPALGQAARYKTFTRVFAPQNSSFAEVKIENAGVIALADPETETLDNRASAGVNVEISPGQTKKLSFSWETPIPQDPGGGEYRLLVRKQAGTLNDLLTINVLTRTESQSYNTSLARDFSARLNF